MVPKEQIKAALRQLELQGYISSALDSKEMKEVLRFYNDQKDDKLVVLPVKVADAIETCLNAMSRITLIQNLDHIDKLFRDYDKKVIDALRAIKEFAYQTVGGSQDLLSALVNGYTVETLESKIEAALLRFVEKAKKADLIIAHDAVEFSKAIAEVVTRALREEQA